MARSRSYIATPPGATIKEQLETRGMSQKEFASRMDMSEKHICKLIQGEVQLTPEVASRLEMVLGLPASFWSNLEAIYRDKLVKISEEQAMDEDVQISKNFPYNNMANNGWVEKTKDQIKRVFSLRKFFEVVTLSLLKNGDFIPGIAYRRQAESEKSEYAIMAWTQKARVDARSIEVSPINLALLNECIPQIRKMTTMEPQEFCPMLKDTLSKCGIAIVFLPHLQGSFLHGASFHDKKKIVIGLTVRGKDADKFWFSLFHEIGHIVLGHISQTSTSTQDEHAADSYAREALIPSADFESFIRAQEGFITESAIIEFAKRITIDPGIVVGRLQKDGYIQFSMFNDLKTKYIIQA